MRQIGTKVTKAYPVWRISARWNNKSCQNNSTFFRWSFKRKFSEKTIKTKAMLWWKKCCQKKYPGEIVELLSFDVEYLGDFKWYLNWFCHRSLNYFANEEDAFASFQSYLDERGFHEVDMGMHQDKNGVKECLMGAEDTWRWKFCGCKVCKRLKITIIRH